MSQEDGNARTHTPSKETAASTKVPTKQQQRAVTKASSRHWSEWAVDGVDFITHLLEFGMKLLSCLLQEAAQEAVEQQTIASYYALLYLTPILSFWLMDVTVWVPHYFPGITMGTVLWWICRQIVNETDPSLLLLEPDSSLVYHASSQPEEPTNTVSKKKTRAMTSRPQTMLGNSSNHNSSNRDPSLEAIRLQELRSIEAKLCHGLALQLRWILPLLVFVQSVLRSPSSSIMDGGEANLPALRLVAAFGLATIKKHQLLSPLTWISGSIQVVLVCVLAARRHHHLDKTYLERWWGLELLVMSLGLATLRFVRLHGVTSARPRHV